MSMVRVDSAPAIHWLIELRKLMREAQQLGVSFTFRGADIVVDHPDSLPAALADPLMEFARSGALFAYLGGGRLDKPAVELGRQLGVESVVVTTVPVLRQAIRQLEADKRQHGRHIGLDIETAPKPGEGSPRPQIAINLDGSVAERQPVNKDRSGLSPHLSDIGCLQLYAGGNRCFILRAAALAMVLRSHWLRRQHFIVHNAVFETAFIQAGTKGYRLPAGRRPRGRVDCSMQGAGLLLGAERSAMGDAHSPILRKNCSPSPFPRICRPAIGPPRACRRVRSPMPPRTLLSPALVADHQARPRVQRPRRCL